MGVKILKVNKFYENGQRIVELLEMDKKRYSCYAAEKNNIRVSRETYKALEEYIDWVLKWITLSEVKENEI